MKNIFYDKKIFYSVIFFLLLILIPGFVWFIGVSRYFQDMQSMGKSYETISSLQDTLMLVRDGEKGFRNYIFTGDKHFLDLFNNSFSQSEGKINALLMAESPSEGPFVADLDKVKARIKSIENYFREVIKVRSKRGQSRAVSLMRGKREETAYNEITRLFNSLMDDQRHRLALLETKTASEKRTVLLVVVVSLVLNFAFLAFVYLTVNFDVRRRRRSQELLGQSESRLQYILDNIQARIFMKDKEGRYLLVNRIFEIYFDQPKMNIIGKTAYNLFPRELADQFTAEDRKVWESGEPLLSEESTPHEDAIRISSTLRFPLFGAGGAVNALCGISYDITRQKQAEQEILRSKEAAEQANRAKTIFLSTISHELRTPLNSIIGFSDVLLGESSGKLNESQKEFMGLVLENGKHLLSLINDLLDISKVEAGKMELFLEEVDFKLFLENCLSMIQQNAANKRINLSFDLKDDLGEIKLDQKQIKQVLFNLLSNAIKFTPEEGSIRLEAARLNENEITVSVIDTGIGIDRKDFSRIFQEFSQIDSEYSRHYQGTGLGLVLAKRLVENHKGRIWFKSEGLNKGTTFTFTLPMDPSKVIIKRNLPDEP